MLILLTRHGESEYNTENRLGGDSSLTENGKQYAKDLVQFQRDHDWFPNECITSTKKRAIQTILDLSTNLDSVSHRNELDEINSGIAENMTYEEFNTKFPQESEMRVENKLSYRYPAGESYEDLIIRVKPIANQILEKRKDILVVCHRAVVRALLYCLTDIDKQDVPHINVPLHQLISIENGSITYLKM